MTEQAPVAEGQVADAAPEAQGQAEPTSWYASAEDEMKGYIQNKGWDDPMKSVQSYKELEKFQGASPDRLLKLPKDGEPMDEIYNRLGRPPTPAEYTYESETGAVDEARLGMYKDIAHQVGISQAQFAKLAEADSQYIAKVQAEYQEQIEQQHTVELQTLEKSWGPAFEERAEIGRRFVASNVPDGMDKKATLEAIENAIGPAAMLKIFANAGEKSNIKEDKLPSGEGDRRFGYSPEQALVDVKTLKADISSDPESLKAFNTGKGSDYEKVKKLNQIIAG